MRKIASWRILILFVFFACNDAKKTSEHHENSGLEKREAEAKPEYELISEERVGIFSLGDPIPNSLENMQIKKSKNTRITEGGPTEEIIYTVSQKGIPQVVLKPKFDPKTGKYNDSIGEIIILSEKYKTDTGIGVNSTLREFQKTYPHFKIWYTYVSDRYVLETKKLPVQFLLKEEDFIGEMEVKSVKVPLEADDFKESAKIKKIRLYEQ